MGGTGFNDAFIISTEQRNGILNDCATEDERIRTAELIRPILRGRDIKRYTHNWANLWLINTHNGVKGSIPRINIDDYPAIKAHLDMYWDKIKIRADQGDTPYNLRNCAYLEDFDKPKVVWARLMRLTSSDIDDFPRFSLVPEGMMTVDSLCFFSGSNLEQLVSVLNSEYATYYFFSNVATLDNGGFQMRQQYVENILLPSDISCIKNDDDIYKSFCFTEEEVQYIKDFVSKRKIEVLATKRSSGK